MVTKILWFYRDWGDRKPQNDFDDDDVKEEEEESTVDPTYDFSKLSLSKQTKTVLFEP